MVVSYARSENNFCSVYDQLKHISSYCKSKDIVVGQEIIDNNSQNKRLEYRKEVVKQFQPLKHVDLIIDDTWVLSTNIEDLVQMFNCLIKNENRVHIINESVVVDKNSPALLLLGLIDKTRIKVLEIGKKNVGRPRGSRSPSKFDRFHNKIIALLAQKTSVSEIARQLEVSRSSLKDYIESRELKKIAFGDFELKLAEDGTQNVINNIRCPKPKE